MHKRLHSILLLASSLVLVSPRASGQLLTIYTLAGRPAPGARDGLGPNAQFNVPVGVASDGAGNIYVADAGGSTIRKISPDRIVTTFAGQPGHPGSTDGVGTNAQFSAPQSIAIDADGNLYVADTGNSTIRKINSAGLVSTLAGAPGNANNFDGPAVSARFNHPQGLAVDTAGAVYVADSWNHTIRKINSSAEVSTLAGMAGNFGAADGTGSKARFNFPSGIAVDTGGNVFVSDFLNHAVRMVTPAGTVSTVAGLAGVWGAQDGTNNSARFFQPQGIVVATSSNLFVIDSGNHTLRSISATGTNWLVTTVAGLCEMPGNLDGTGSGAQFYFPAGLALDSAGALHIADSGNNSVRTDRVSSPILQFLVSPGQIVLNWPASSINFGLETTTNLSSQVWVPVSDGVATVGDSLMVTNSRSASAALYRLHQRSGL